jgi:hypothetical protein
MTRALRHDDKSNGLVLANGGFLTHEHAIVLSKKPSRTFGFPLEGAHHQGPSIEIPVFDEHAKGEAVIEVSNLQKELILSVTAHCVPFFVAHLIRTFSSEKLT